MLRNGSHPASQNRNGFTLIELLVVVLVLAILMAVALPLYLSAVSDSQRKVCRANMQTISNAIMAANVKSGASDFSAIISAGVTTSAIPDLTTIPVCPSGGHYVLGFGNSNIATTFQVRCTYGASLHGTFQPGLDSN